VTPAALLRKPTIAEGLSFYWRAFDDLVDERQYFPGGGCSRIAYSAIDRWAVRRGVAGEAFERLKRTIWAMDRVWRDERARRLKEETERA
jgi:hypothetical protein